jgi:nucleoside-diphosphate-sugar epimerase
VVQALSRATLAHVHVVHGSKYYGHQLGPVTLPMREENTRAAGRNFYFEQQDFLQDRSRDEGWTYTISRPHTFCDAGTDMPRSIGLLVAVYAAIQRELGLPLDFPGTARAYAARTQFTDVGLLARAIVWMAHEPRCANEAFNVVNGDCPRWSELWPQFAEAVGLAPGRALGIDMGQYMADKAPVWHAVIRRHGLRETALHELVLWPYGNYVFKPEWDIMSSTEKLRACGFQEAVDSAAMFARHFDGYRAAGIIPP